MFARSDKKGSAGLCALFAVVTGGAGLHVNNAYADRGAASTAAFPAHDKGAGVVGLKIGALLPQAFTPLSTSYFLEVEGGYLLPFVHRLLGVTASFAMSMPSVSGDNISDSRLPSGSYSYTQTTQQYMLGVTALIKIPLGRFVPYLGVGPRMFFVRTLSSGSAQDGAAILESTELSKEIAVGVPLGLDVLLGPGRAFFEGQLLYAGSSQRSTGPSSFGSITLALGYRLVL